MPFTITGTDHTGITVSDLDRAVEFWSGVLGFPVERRAHLTGEFAAQVTGVPDADIATAVIAAPGHRIELLEYRSPTPHSGRVPSPATPGSKHLAFTVDDLDDLMATLAAHDWTAEGSARTLREGARAGTRFVYLRDPDGTTVEFIQPPRAS